jgi:hypothetical protein
MSEMPDGDDAVEFDPADYGIDPADYHAGVQAWAGTRTLAELADLTVAWLVGATTYYPGYLAPGPAKETADLVDRLVAMNRGGLVTSWSQPGIPFDGMGAQRAVVAGWCSAMTLDTLNAAILGTDLVALAYPVDCADELDPVPVTINAGEPFTWAAPSDLSDLFERDGKLPDSPEFQDAWFVTIIDPVWGRDHLLWGTVLGALSAAAPA